MQVNWVAIDVYICNYVVSRFGNRELNDRVRAIKYDKSNIFKLKTLFLFFLLEYILFI